MDRRSDVAFTNTRSVVAFMNSRSDVPFMNISSDFSEATMEVNSTKSAVNKKNRHNAGENSSNHRRNDNVNLHGSDKVGIVFNNSESKNSVSQSEGKVNSFSVIENQVSSHSGNEGGNLSANNKDKGVSTCNCRAIWRKFAAAIKSRKSGKRKTYKKKKMNLLSNVQGDKQTKVVGAGTSTQLPEDDDDRYRPPTWIYIAPPTVHYMRMVETESVHDLFRFPGHRILSKKLNKMYQSRLVTRCSKNINSAEDPIFQDFEGKQTESASGKVSEKASMPKSPKIWTRPSCQTDEHNDSSLCVPKIIAVSNESNASSTNELKTKDKILPQNAVTEKVMHRSCTDGQNSSLTHGQSKNVFPKPFSSFPHGSSIRKKKLEMEKVSEKASMPKSSKIWTRSSCQTDEHNDSPLCVPKIIAVSYESNVSPTNELKKKEDKILSQNAVTKSVMRRNRTNRQNSFWTYGQSKNEFPKPFFSFPHGSRIKEKKLDMGKVSEKASMPKSPKIWTRSSCQTDEHNDSSLCVPKIIAVSNENNVSFTKGLKKKEDKILIQNAVTKRVMRRNCTDGQNSSLTYGQSKNVFPKPFSSFPHGSSIRKKKLEMGCYFSFPSSSQDCPQDSSETETDDRETIFHFMGYKFKSAQLVPNIVNTTAVKQQHPAKSASNSEVKVAPKRIRKQKPVPTPQTKKLKTCKKDWSQRDLRLNALLKLEKRRWTNEEKKAVTNHFQSYILNGILPDAAAIRKCVSAVPVLHSKSWKNILGYCQKMIVALKKRHK